MTKSRRKIAKLLPVLDDRPTRPHDAMYAYPRRRHEVVPPPSIGRLLDSLPQEEMEEAE